jgi:hypothetical protein
MIFPIHAFFASADPLLATGAVSGQWIMVILVAIVAFFLVRTLNRLETDLKSLTKDVSEIRTSQITQESEMNTIKKSVESINPERISEIAMAKLLAAGGGAPGRHWPFGRRNEDQKEHGDY